MASHDLVLLLETPALRSSTWTKWEASFAWAYHLGPAAVHFTNGTALARVAKRFHVGVAPAALQSSHVDTVVTHVRTWRTELAVRRRAYYESLVHRAAGSKHGRAMTGSDGVLTVKDRHGSDRAAVLVSAVPGRLRHAKRLAGATAAVRFLAGDHAHLSESDADDFRWLVRQTRIEPVGKPGVYRKIRSVL
jgi:hypothetical protein